MGRVEVIVCARQEVAGGLDTTISVEDILVQDLDVSVFIGKDHDVFGGLYGAKIERFGRIVIGFVVASVFEADGSVGMLAFVVENDERIIVSNAGVFAFLGIKKGVVWIVADGGFARTG